MPCYNTARSSLHRSASQVVTRKLSGGCVTTSKKFILSHLIDLHCRLCIVLLPGEVKGRRREGEEGARRREEEGGRKEEGEGRKRYERGGGVREEGGGMKERGGGKEGGRERKGDRRREGERRSTRNSYCVV